MDDGKAGRRLPPLRSLEAFAVAGRTFSFTAAADELHLTTSAVSRRIRALEKELGLKLFDRTGNALRLTEAGQRYHDTVAGAFRDLRAATGDLRQRGKRRPVRISLLPSFASNWLVPRLGDFYRRHPEIELQLETGTRYVDLDRDGFDFAIRLCTGDWPGLDVDPLLDIEVFPVCSQALTRTVGGIADPACLSRQVLLHCKHSIQVWQDWLNEAGYGDVTPDRQIYLDDFNMMYQAATNDLGIGMGWEPIVRPYIESGQLVAPFEFRLGLPKRFHLVGLPGERDRPAARAFRQWLTETAQADAA